MLPGGNRSPGTPPWAGSDPLWALPSSGGSRGAEKRTAIMSVYLSKT